MTSPMTTWPTALGCRPAPPSHSTLVSAHTRSACKHARHPSFTSSASHDCSAVCKNSCTHPHSLWCSQVQLLLLESCCCGQSTRTEQAAAERAAAGLGGTSVYLVGMMGSGKSTVGRMLARALRHAHSAHCTMLETT